MDDPAAFEQRDVGGQFHGFADLVRRHDDGGAARQRAREKRLLQDGDGAIVERGERLVEQQKSGIVQEGARDGEALPHAAGEFAGHAVFHPVEADAFERLHRRGFRIRDARQTGRKASDFQAPRGRRRRRYRGPDSRSRTVRADSPKIASPLVGFERLARMRSSVVFPAPLRPSSATQAPGATSRVAPRSAG